MKKNVENCDNCDVEDQPESDRACELCAEDALQKGRLVGISPETSQIIEARSMIKIGYPFEKNDLQYWQWKCLIAIDREIDKYHAEKIKNAGHK